MIYIMGLLFLIAVISILVPEFVNYVELKKISELNKEYNESNVTLNHISGLPVISNTDCQLTLESDKIEIKAGGNTFYLNLDKITEFKVLKKEKIDRDFATNKFNGKLYQRETIISIYYLNITFITNNRITYVIFNIPLKLLPILRKWEKDIVVTGQKTIEL